MDLMKACSSEVNLWYLDDGTLGGNPETVQADLARIIAASQDLGLQINSKKCELYVVKSNASMEAASLSPETRAQLDQIKLTAPGIRILKDQDLTLLGAPILEESGNDVLLSKLQDLSLMVERLEDIDAHDALFLLKNCFSIPKLMYFLRCAPCFKHQGTLHKYDEKLRECLQKILNIQLEDGTWEQCSLPVANGGLGIRRASDLAVPTFMSSSYGARNTMERLLPECIFEQEYQALNHGNEAWAECFNNNDVVQPENPTVQASWDTILCDKKYQELLSTQDCPREKARLLAVASEHSSDWLNAIPVPALGLKLDDSSLRIACGLRLGTKLCEPYTCICGAQVDNNGRHGLSCKKAKGTFARHAHSNELIKRALATANVPSVLEPTGLTRNDGKRLDGLTLFPWSQGRNLIWDFTCRDTLAQSYVAQTSKGAGKAAELAEQRKLAHYEELSAQYIITPVATETLGSWGTRSIKFIKELGKRIIDATGEKRSTCYLFQSLSIATQRGNIASIKGSMPNHKTMHEIYYL